MSGEIERDVLGGGTWSENQIIRPGEIEMVKRLAISFSEDWVVMRGENIIEEIG